MRRNRGLAELLLLKPIRAGGSRPSQWPRQGNDPRLDELPVRQSMKGRWRNRKEHESGGTGALHRYLHSRVGRCWDDVYADICREVPETSPAWQRVQLFLDFDVQRDVQIIEGKPMVNGAGRLHEVWGGDFWVHPDTGVLMYQVYKKWSFGDPKPSFKQVPIDELHRYVRINGLWYLVTFAQLPETVQPSPFYNGIFGDELGKAQPHRTEIADWGVRDGEVDQDLARYLKSQVGLPSDRVIKDLLRRIPSGRLARRQVVSYLRTYLHTVVDATSGSPRIQGRPIPAGHFWVDPTKWLLDYVPKLLCDVVFKAEFLDVVRSYDDVRRKLAAEWSAPIYAVSKRALNTAEIRDLLKAARA